MQAVQPQIPGLPSKPDCLVWYAGDPCDLRIEQYHQALEQHRQVEWQATVTGPLRTQLADQQKQLAAQQNQIKMLQLKMESQTVEASQNQARNEALLNGIGAGVGAALALLVAVAGFRRLARNSSPSREDQERAASASGF
jgi:hypothetical protein